MVTTEQQEDIDKITSLLKSGDSANIELAFMLISSNKLRICLWAWGDLSVYLRNHGDLGKYKTFNDGIRRIGEMRELALRQGNLHGLGSCFSFMPYLTGLHLTQYKDITLPENITEIHNLKYIVFDGCIIESLPKGISTLKNIVRIDIDCHNMNALPKGICTIPNLETLTIRFSKLTSLPNNIGDLKHLKKLVIDGKQIESLPESINRLGNLTEIIVKNGIVDISNLAPNIIDLIKTA